MPDAIDVVMQHGRFINGPEIVELSQRLQLSANVNLQWVWVQVQMQSLALKALGIAAGDHIITSIWLASATTIAQTGAIPVFADVNEDLNINLDSVRENLNHKTKAILPSTMPVRFAKSKSFCTIAEAQRNSAD